jgi:hypothetical protein
LQGRGLYPEPAKLDKTLASSDIEALSGPSTPAQTTETDVLCHGTVSAIGKEAAS